MPKRIVICPSFAEAHLMGHHIQNMIDVLNPDVIIYNEGLFPNGPENKGHVNTPEFKKKWLYQNSNCGFDWEESNKVVDREQRASDVLIRINEMKYQSTTADECFREAISNFKTPWETIDVQPGDLIFPLEPDAFLWEGDTDTINSELNELQPGEGLCVRWVDFLETQYYTEEINLHEPKYRRFAYCFDTVENYIKAIGSGFMSQSYPKLKRVESFFIRHYCWFRPGPYKQLRYELIHRPDPKYWDVFDDGLATIRLESMGIANYMWDENTQEYQRIRRIVAYNASQQIVIRPNATGPRKFAHLIYVKHPNAIKSHPNFIS